MSPKTREHITYGLIAVALVVAIAGPIGVATALSGRPQPASEPRHYYKGYYRSTDVLDLADINVGAGTFLLRYNFDVRFVDTEPAAALTCALNDPSKQVLAFSPRSTETIRSSPQLQHVQFSSVYGLPPTSIGLRCHVTAAGIATAQFDNVVLGAELGPG